jgi:hypothetical protein
MMKQITNVSLQSWSIPMRTSKGVEHVYLQPKQSIQVPASYLTDYCIRFQQRKLITIKNA